MTTTPQHLMEEDASRINSEQTLERNLLPSGHSGEGRHSEVSLDHSGKDSKTADENKSKKRKWNKHKTSGIATKRKRQKKKHR